jgi:hypothetical protein
MRNIHSTILLVAFAASATACSGSPDGAPPTVTSNLDALSVASHAHHHGAIVPQLKKVSPTMEATTPDNGDQNPYGVAFVPRGFPKGGLLEPGDVIVSNFNNSKDQGNLQGTGTTIVRPDRKGGPDLFFQDSAIAGLSTALGVLERGFVIVGNVPSIGQTLGTCNDLQTDVGPGQLTVLDRHGDIVATLDDRPFVDGPWDLTIDDHGDFARLYVSNVLAGTVVRIDLHVGRHTVWVERETVIASGYTISCDPAAFVLGPTGLAHDEKRDILYVASTADNVIFAVKDASDRCSDAGMGKPVVTDMTHLHGPLGLALAANGDLISAQGDAVNTDNNQPSEIVEFTKHGDFVDQISVDTGTGGAFGLALEQRRDDPDDFRFAAVNDNVPNLDVWDIH